jgi:hypothetical protein
VANLRCWRSFYVPQQSTLSLSQPLNPLDGMPVEGFGAERGTASPGAIGGVRLQLSNDRLRLSGGNITLTCLERSCKRPVRLQEYLLLG